jgi:FKBP-type peptidyl-prolyl cis-trans isomerase
MKNYKSLVLLFALVTGVSTLSSCQKTKVTEKDAIEFTYINEGSEKPANGNFLLYNLEILTQADSIIISSLEDPFPQGIIINDTIKPQSGIEEILFGLKKGDSINFQVPAKMIMGENTPPGIKSDDLLKVRLGAFEIKTEAEMQALYEEIGQKEQKKAVERAKALIVEEAKTIEAFLTKNNLKAQKTQSGLYYVIEKEGTGEATTPGTTMYVNYAGYLLDGPLFDTSWPELAKANNKFNPERPYEPLRVNVGMGEVIPGWDEGLMLLKKGSKAKLIIPSPLGYGERAAGADIPANSILLFDVEVTDVQK